MRRRRFQTLAGLAVAALLVGGCGGASDPVESGSETTAAPTSQPGGASETQKGQWAGQVEGTDAFVAIVSDGSSTTAYLCDGAAIDEWFTSSSGTSIQDEKGEIALDVKRDGDSWTGTVTLPDGRTQAITTEPSEEVVLYRAAGEDDDISWLGGWIVRDTEQRGSLVIRSATTSTQTSPTLDTSSLTLNSSVTSSNLVVQPVSPLKLPTGAIPTTNAWTVFGRVTRANSAGVGGVSVRFARSDGSSLGRASTSPDGSYRLTMSVPLAPIAVTVTVVDVSGRVLPTPAPVRTTSVPGGSSTVNVVLG